MEKSKQIILSTFFMQRVIEKKNALSMLEDLAASSHHLDFSDPISSDHII